MISKYWAAFISCGMEDGHHCHSCLVYNWKSGINEAIRSHHSRNNTAHIYRALPICCGIYKCYIIESSLQSYEVNTIFASLTPRLKS